MMQQILKYQLKTLILQGSGEAPSDLKLVGDIRNVRGNVSIIVGGSFFVEMKANTTKVATIRAGTLNILVGGDFVQGYADGLFHTGGDPVDDGFNTETNGGHTHCRWR